MSARLSDQRGDSLLEILLAVAILGTLVAGAMGALGSGVIGFRTNRRQAQLDTLTRSYAEAAKRQIELQSGPLYQPCATSYSGVSFSLGSAYDATLFAVPTISKVEVLVPSGGTGTFQATTVTPCTDSGVQRLTITGQTLPAKGPIVSDQLQIVVRTP